MFVRIGFPLMILLSLYCDLAVLLCLHPGDRIQGSITCYLALPTVPPFSLSFSLSLPLYLSSNSNPYT